MNLAQVIAKALKASGVTDVFCILGNGNLRLAHSLAADQGISVHHLRHEGAAVAAAQGYAAATGQCGIATVTQGPGLTNALTALVTAHRARSSLVVVTADSSASDAATKPFDAVQALDPNHILGPLGIPVIRASPADGYRSTLEAEERARQASSPVVLSLRTGDDAQECTDVASPKYRLADALTMPHVPDLSDAVAALRQAERPIILAGAGAMAAEAELEALAAATGAFLATTFRGIGLFAGNARNIGVAGGLSTDDARLAIADSDCVVAFGASLNHFTTSKRTLFADATVIHVDLDPGARARFVEVDVFVCADARDAAHGLLVELGGTEKSTWREQRQSTFEDASAPYALDPRAVCAELDRLLPTERAVVVDAGHFSAFPIQHLTYREPSKLQWTIDFGAVGGSVGVAIGTAIGQPNRPTILFVGDGGFSMSMGDFLIPPLQGLPLVVVCLNDQGYGSEMGHLQAAGLPIDQAELPTPNVASIANALGYAGHTISDLAQIRPVIEDWLIAREPLFLDCLISREVRSPLYKHS